MATFLQDLRYALRMLAKSPGFTAVAVLTLALGIGANTAIFTMLKGIVLRPLPGVRNANQMVVVISTTRGGQSYPLSYPDYRDFRDRNAVFSALVASSQYPTSITVGDRSERVWAEFVSGNYFEALGVKTALGRILLSEDDKVQGGQPVVVISHALWKKQFGSDPSVIGTSIHLGTRPVTIVGVTQPDFHGSVVGLALDVFLPLGMHPEAAQPVNLLEQRNSHWLVVQGRLKPAVTLERARAEMAVLGRQIAEAYPNEELLERASLLPLWKSPFGSQRYLFPILSAVMVVAGLVLLVACGNLANVFLARAAGRQREVAVRLAVGASRGRLVRQLMTESMLISLLGGAAALLLSLWTNEWFTNLAPPTPLPIVLEAKTDAMVFGFTLLVAIATAVIFGLAPALQATKVNVVPALKQNVSAGQRHFSRFRRGLVVWQMSLSLILLICAGLAIRSKRNAAGINPGFEAKGVAVLSVDLQPNGYDSSTGRAVFRRLLERAQSLPEVQSASLARRLPLLVIGAPSRTLEVEGYVARADEDMSVKYNVVTPDYFQTLRIPSLQGRGFTPRDDDKAADVAIVNETMARHFWPSQEAIGLRIRTDGRWRQVIGVVRDIKYLTLTEAPQPYLYLPLAQNYSSDMILHVRTGSDPVALLKTLQNEIRALDPNLPVFGTRTMSEHMQFSLAGYALAALLLTRTGLLAMLLASVGLYGVISYSVTQRTHEIGVRMALGAQPDNVLRLIVAQGVQMALLGMLFGLAGALAGTRLLSGLLYGVSPIDPATFASVAGLLLAVALAACYIPARRATRVDPLVALRYE